MRILNQMRVNEREINVIQREILLNYITMYYFEGSYFVTWREVMKRNEAEMSEVTL